MKYYIKSTSYQYNGYTIYEDSKSGVSYIYTEPKGRGRMDFSTSKEAEEYIDDCIDPEIKFFEVWYVTDSDSTQHIEIEAENAKDARRKVKSQLGRSCHMVTDVYEIER